MHSHDYQGAREANVAQIAKNKARASAAVVASANRALLDAGAAGQPAAPVAVAAAGAIILTSSLTAKVTGKFAVRVHYKVTSDGGATHTATPSLAAGPTGGAITTRYTGETVNVPAVNGTPTTDSLYFEVDGIALGAPGVTFHFVLAADADAHLTVGAHGAQMDIEELPA